MVGSVCVQDYSSSSWSLAPFLPFCVPALLLVIWRLILARSSVAAIKYLADFLINGGDRAMRVLVGKLCGRTIFIYRSASYKQSNYINHHAVDCYSLHTSNMDR